jgi:hypothetical protein
MIVWLLKSWYHVESFVGTVWVCESLVLSVDAICQTDMK